MLSKNASGTSRRLLRSAAASTAARVARGKVSVPSFPRSGGAVTAGALKQSSGQRRTQAGLSAAQTAVPPYPTVIIYNQSKHSCQSVLADIRAVWGDKIRVLQTIEEGLQPLPGVDAPLYIASKTWADLDHFKLRLDAACSQDHSLAAERAKGDVVFMPGWSAFAESSEAAVAVQALGLAWPGTEPVASAALEKIGFKRFCAEVGAPTPPFEVLSEEGKSANLSDQAVKEEVVKQFMATVAAKGFKEPGLIKSIHGGGGKGTAHLDKPGDAAEVRAAVEKVLNEMNRSDGIYFEQKVNMKGDGNFYQLELEVDGTTVAQGGRFVWFNSRLQKCVEIGLADDLIPLFMPADLYQKSREWSRLVAEKANNNTRATMEGLVFKNEKGEFELQFIECNRRPQVENEALALLQRDSDGNRRYTFAELMMRSRGHPPPAFESSEETKVVLHARWLHGNPDSKGDIAYQAGNVLGMSGPRLDFIPAELMAPGEISFTSDPQLGKAVITAGSWDQMCDRACEYFTLRKPMIQGSSSTYAQTMYNLFSSADFRAGKVASNQTFTKLKIPEYPSRTIRNVLEDQVSPILVKGYRPGEGIDADRYPTQNVMKMVEEVTEALGKETPTSTAYTSFARGEASYEDYVKSLREQLAKQGGGWVTVAPRDTMQQGNDSESATFASVGRMNAEVWAQKGGCVGYETGGAQYQAGLIRGFDPAAIMVLGLPFNMPAHSLQRSQYVNGLAELTPEIRKALFESTAELVSNHYRPRGSTGSWVPWQPYNFHAGNYFDAERNYSPQDKTTAELLEAKCLPMPNWVFSPKFSLEALEKWTGRQIDLFSAAGQPLHQIRMKNPGQGKEWTAEAIWTHVKTMISVFEKRGLPPPIVYIHNHDFNGTGGHVGAAALRLAQKDGFSNLVIDAAYRKNGTHNDNTVVTDALTLTTAEQEALVEYNHLQQQIEQAICRFDSRNSQMTPWDSDWAGGTEGSDIRIAKEFNINPRLINHAKEVATEVFPLERAVTPFSEYKMRLGLGIMIEDGIQPKSAEKVREWVNKGGKLKVGGDVLVGLKRWETLVDKSPEVDKLLENMPDELNGALAQQAKLIGPGDLPKDFTASQRHTALGYQAKGLEFAQKVQPSGADLSPLLVAPTVLHARPLSLAVGTKFELMTNPPLAASRAQVQFQGFGKKANGDITLTYLIEGASVEYTQKDPNAGAGVQAKSGPRKATPGNAHELPCIVPGEILSYSVKVGDVLKAGDPLVVLESMKMEMKISVPDELDGMKVKNLPCKGRTKELQGDILSPGDLLLELEDA